MIGYRHGDRRYPFFWESPDQPPARWHAKGHGPAQYLANTPAGAWAEFLRHEEITEEKDLQGIARALWAVNIEDSTFSAPKLTDDALFGDERYYPECQAEAARLRKRGAVALQAPSAALYPGAACGCLVHKGVHDGPPADGQVYVLFGPRPTTVGWLIVDEGRPPASVLPLVRHL
ncbi:RES family NAD+ phosphorylase [Pseudarthrobacter sp. NPDC058329]|uniref:RES family NAD+ phosphorylase n=1 Tax=Pseudarthrobacter sp. NPDC058329 TaxID=3346448 RepID=UPI0036D76919